MAKHPRYGLALGVFLLAMAPGATAGPKGYLASLGPAPLRFQAARPVVVVEKKEMPPLPQNAVPTPTSTPAATNQLVVPPAPEPTNENSVAPVPTNEAPVASAGYSPEAALPQVENTQSTLSPWMQDAQSPAGVEPGPVNPQSVTSYLTPGPTNAEPAPIRGRFVMPAFVPPIPPAPRSSQATYESR